MAEETTLPWAQRAVFYVFVFGGGGVALFGDGAHAIAGAILAVGGVAMVESTEWRQRRTNG